jgi:hypothetical protein
MSDQVSRRAALALGATTLASVATAQRIAPPSSAPVTITYYNYNLPLPASAPKRRRN